MRSKFELIEDGDSNTDDLGPDLISLADLKLALGISDDDDDESLSADITLWSELIAEYLDRRLPFARARETFTFGLYESASVLVLQLYPIVDVESVTVDGSTAEFDFDSETGVLFPAAGSVWSGTVVVEYSGGYVLPDGAPARLRMAIIEAIRSARQLASNAASSGGSGQTVREITHGDTHVSFATTQQTTQSSSSGSAFLPINVVDLVRPLKRITV